MGVRKVDKNTASAAAETAAPRQASGPAEYVVSVDGKDVFMAFEGNMVTVDGRVFRVAIKPQSTEGAAPAPVSTGGQVTEVKSQMPGAVYKLLVKVGEEVKAGEAILILEAMKMEMEVASPVNGTIQSLNLSVGDQVATGQVLATIRA